MAMVLLHDVMYKKVEVYMDGMVEAKKFQLRLNDCLDSASRVHVQCPTFFW